MFLSLLQTCLLAQDKKQSKLLSSNPATKRKRVLLPTDDKAFFKMANIIDKLYLLKAHTNYKVVTRKQVFCADNLHILSKCLFLPIRLLQKDVSAGLSLERQQISFAFTHCWNAAATFGKNWALGHGLHDHHSQPCTNSLRNPEQKPTKKRNNNKKTLLRSLSVFHL